MSMGGPDDHPITDMLHHGRNPFPTDVADMLRKLNSINPKILNTFALEAYDWAEGRALDEGRAKLAAELLKHESRS
jgi:hypothetical protein